MSPLVKIEDPLLNATQKAVLHTLYRDQRNLTSTPQLGQEKPMAVVAPQLSQLNQLSQLDQLNGQVRKEDILARKF